MALKGDRVEHMTDISHFLNEVAERGGCLVRSTSGSGAALDQSAALLTYKVNPTGMRPVGILLNDMVSIDQTRQNINYHKDEVQIGGKVTALRQGWVVTNMIEPHAAPSGNLPAYLVGSGFLSTIPSSTGGIAQTPLVGEWGGQKDEDGYAKLYVNLP